MRALIPLLVVAGLSYGLPMVFPRKPDEAASADLGVDPNDPMAIAKDAGDAMVALPNALPVTWQEDVVKLADVETLKGSSLVAPTTVLAFLTTVLHPLYKDLWSDAGVSVVTAVSRLSSGFELLNALGFWLEALGYYGGFIFGYASAFGLLDGLYLGPSMGLYVGIVFQMLLALSVGYILYWMVLHTTDPNYKLLATAIYLVISFGNLYYATFCLFGGIELLRFVTYMVKAVVAFGCAYYATKLRKQADAGTGEDFLVVTAQHQPTPAFPGRAAADKAAPELM